MKKKKIALIIILFTLSGCVPDSDNDPDFTTINGLYKVNKTEKLDEGALLCAKFYITNNATEESYSTTLGFWGSESYEKVSHAPADLIATALNYQIFERNSFQKIDEGTSSIGKLEYGMTSSVEVPYSDFSKDVQDPYFSARLLSQMERKLSNGTSASNGLYHDSTEAIFNQINCGKIIFVTLDPVLNQVNSNDPYGVQRSVTFTEADVPGLTKKEKSDQLKRISRIIENSILLKTRSEVAAIIDPKLFIKGKLAGDYSPVIRDSVNYLVRQYIGHEDGALPTNVKEALIGHITKTIQKSVVKR